MQQKTSAFRISLDALQHRRRCERLPALEAGEADRLIANFLASNSITVCPARYVLPVEQRPQYGRSAY
ncbi:MAG TPA: hypothetical protein VMB34_14705 [Acetobacteraceae bacterium]|nr:hypothetical protein [Acetobacteraceae bacterium]